jgi:hypothetical protein
MGRLSYKFKFFCFLCFFTNLNPFIKNNLCEGSQDHAVRVFMYHTEDCIEDQGISFMKGT